MLCTNYMSQKTIFKKETLGKVEMIDYTCYVEGWIVSPKRCVDVLTPGTCDLI